MKAEEKLAVLDRVKESEVGRELRGPAAVPTRPVSALAREQRLGVHDPMIRKMTKRSRTPRRGFAGRRGWIPHEHSYNIVEESRNPDEYL